LLTKSGQLTPDELAAIQSWIQAPSNVQKPNQPAQTAPQAQPTTKAQAQSLPKSRKCSDALVKKLHDEVKKACEQERSCSMQGDTCATATAKVAAGNACIAAREKMQRTCFSPGDPGYQGHMQQIAEAYAALRNCVNVMQAKCK
jgi:hypothetical protein